MPFHSAGYEGREIKRNPHKISMSKLQEKISVLPGKDFGQYTLEAKAFSIEDM